MNILLEIISISMYLISEGDWHAKEQLEEKYLVSYFKKDILVYTHLLDSFWELIHNSYILYDCKPIENNSGRKAKSIHIVLSIYMFNFFYDFFLSLL